MSLFLGTSAINNVYLGSTPAQKVYLGSSLIWSAINFGAVGAGKNANSGSPSFSATIAPDDNGILILGATNAQSSSITVSGTVGGTAMTSLLTPFLANTNGANRLFLYALCLLNPPTGTQTVALSISGFFANPFNAVNSLSYKGVTSFGTPVTNFGTTGPASVAASSTGRIAAAMAANAGLTAFSSLTGGWTSEYNQAGVSNTNRPVLIGDGPGGSQTFGADIPASATGWGAIAVPVL